MSKKVAIVGTVGLPAKYGGFETLAENISLNLNKDFDFTIYCSSVIYKQKLKTYNNCRLKYINLKPNGKQSIPYDIFSILDAIKSSEIILILGVSGCLILPFLKPFYKTKFIVNIDGCEWRRGKWGLFARYFLKISERIAVKYADVIISDNLIIKNYINLKYNKISDLIAYGGDHVKRTKISKDLLNLYPFLYQPYFIKVCRIEPENNIEMILKSFIKLKSKTLVIVGNWNFSKYAKKIKSKYSIFHNIKLIDSIYNQKILDQLRSNACCYIHGHSAGGTNPSLVEAMNLGLPIISYGAEYNKVTTKNMARYFNSSSDLVKILSELDDYNLNEMSKRMSKIAKDEYSWGIIANKYKKLISSI